MIRRFAQSARIRIRGSLRALGLFRHELFAVYLRATTAARSPQAAIADIGNPSRILVIRIDDVGDFVLTTPFLRALRDRFPGAHISLVVTPPVLALARTCPYVDEVIPFRFARTWPPLDQIRAFVRARRFARRELAPRNFECAVIPRADTDNACALAMPYYAGIETRIGYAVGVLPQKRMKNLGYDRFLTHPIGTLSGAHEVEWSLHAAAALGAVSSDRRLELWPPASATAAAEGIVSGFTTAGRPLVAMAPGANLDRRRWPAERFRALAELLIRELGAGVIVIGGQEDVAAGKQIQLAGDGVASFAGGLTWPQTAALLGMCDLFIGNDSGPLHVAAAMRTACIELSCHPRAGDPLGANSPARFGPWGVRAAVLQPDVGIPPCSTACVMPHAHCIRAVSVADALAAARKLLETSSPGTTVPHG